MGWCLSWAAGEFVFLPCLVSVLADIRQILSNPAKATKSNLAGITYTISRMDWYCALVEHVLNKDNIMTGSKSFEEVLHQLEDKVISLYKALLLYQMKSVCSYYQNQGLVFLRGLLNLDDWSSDLKSVTDMETAVRIYIGDYVQEETREVLREVADHAKGMEKLLEDLLQDVRDLISAQKKLHIDAVDTDCRRDLRVVDPQHDMERIEKSKDELLDDAVQVDPQHSRARGVCQLERRCS